MNATTGKLTTVGMFGPHSVDVGPFTCPVCRAVSFEVGNANHGFCKYCRAVTAIPFDGPGLKVLVVGDAGGSLEWLTDDVIPYAKATDCTTIMQLGDFGLVWHKETVSQNLDDLHACLTEADLTLTFLPGNHENHPLLQVLADQSDRNEHGHHMLRPTIFYTGRVSAWSWGGLRVAAVGGAPSIDGSLRVAGQTWWPVEEILSPDEMRHATGLGPVDILFTHDAPVGVPMQLIPDLAATAHRASMTTLGRALMPTYWFHGHYHDTFHYRFYHDEGVAAVRGLGCNHSEKDTEAMVAINLDSIRGGLEATRMERGGAT